MSPTKLAVVSEIESLVATKLAGLTPVEQCWQPSDFVPDLTKESWREDLTEFRKAAQGLSNELLVVLAGSTATEEALPSYQTSLNRLQGLEDKTGASPNPWACWSRAWTAEENRHGDLLNRYLYLTGRVDMRSLEKSIQGLIRNGFDPGHFNDPYFGLVYTSFQERATRISHGKVASIAKQEGESALGKICNVIAADEARHEDAYKSFMGRVFELDPSGAVLAMDTMLDQTIVMPAHLMADESSPSLFAQFSTVAQRMGVYTILDYISIIEHLLQVWDVEHLAGLTADAAKAQEKLCGLTRHYRRRAAFYDRKIADAPKASFQWIYQNQA